MLSRGRATVAPRIFTATSVLNPALVLGQTIGVARGQTKPHGFVFHGKIFHRKLRKDVVFILDFHLKITNREVTRGHR